MTYREKLKKDTGRGINGFGCPSDHGYEERPSFYTHCASTTCKACWSREIEEKEQKPMKHKLGETVLVQGNIIDMDYELQRYTVNIAGKHTAQFTDRELFELPKQEKTYEQGLEDAWELARKIAIRKSTSGFEGCKLAKIFGFDDIDEIFMGYTPKEAIAKFKAYEESQENNVGDVVTNHNLGRCIVLEKRNDGLLSVLTESGEVRIRSQDALHKTGKHIDIESILEQIKGDANE